MKNSARHANLLLVAFVVIAAALTLAVSAGSDSCKDAGGRNVVAGYQTSTMMIGKVPSSVSMPVNKCEMPN